MAAAQGLGGANVVDADAESLAFAAAIRVLEEGLVLGRPARLVVHRAQVAVLLTAYGSCRCAIIWALLVDSVPAKREQRTHASAADREGRHTAAASAEQSRRYSYGRKIGPAEVGRSLLCSPNWHRIFSTAWATHGPP